MEVNGRDYPMWGGFVAKKGQFIGGTLQDYGDSMDRAMGIAGASPPQTIIKDIELRPNGDDSAFFEVIGEEFSCGFSTDVGGVMGGEAGWITFSGYGGHKWRIKVRPAEAE